MWPAMVVPALVMLGVLLLLPFVGQSIVRLLSLSFAVPSAAKRPSIAPVLVLRCVRPTSQPPAVRRVRGVTFAGAMAGASFPGIPGSGVG